MAPGERRIPDAPGGADRADEPPLSADRGHHRRQRRRRRIHRPEPGLLDRKIPGLMDELADGGILRREHELLAPMPAAAEAVLRSRPPYSRQLHRPAGPDPCPPESYKATWPPCPAGCCTCANSPCCSTAHLRGEEAPQPESGSACSPRPASGRTRVPPRTTPWWAMSRQEAGSPQVWVCANDLGPPASLPTEQTQVLKNWWTSISFLNTASR